MKSLRLDVERRGQSEIRESNTYVCDVNTLLALPKVVIKSPSCVMVQFYELIDSVCSPPPVLVCVYMFSGVYTIV